MNLKCVFFVLEFDCWFCVCSNFVDWVIVLLLSFLDFSWVIVDLDIESLDCRFWIIMFFSERFCSVDVIFLWFIFEYVLFEFVRLLFCRRCLCCIFKSFWRFFWLVWVFLSWERMCDILVFLEVVFFWVIVRLCCNCWVIIFVVVILFFLCLSCNLRFIIVLRVCWSCDCICFILLVIVEVFFWYSLIFVVDLFVFRFVVDVLFI